MDALRYVGTLNPGAGICSDSGKASRVCWRKEKGTLVVSVNGRGEMEGDCKCGDGTGVLVRTVMAGGRWSRPVSRQHGKPSDSMGGHCV